MEHFIPDWFKLLICIALKTHCYNFSETLEILLDKVLPLNETLVNILDDGTVKTKKVTKKCPKIYFC